MAVSNDPKHMFNAPIAGASLTTQPNSAPWQQPPQYTDLHEALVYMWNVIFKDPSTILQVCTFLKHGVTVMEITNTFLFAGIGGGKWSVDLALLMYQTVAHQIETLAKLRKIKYTFKRVDPKLAAFMQEYQEYLIEPESEPVKKEAKSLFATGLGLDNTASTGEDQQ